MSVKETLQKFLDAEGGNILSLLDDSTVHTISRLVCDDYETDVTDPRYLKKKEMWEAGQEIAQLIQKDKNFPFENAANIKYPLLAVSAIQFNSRAYQSIVQGNSVVKPKIVGEAVPFDPRLEQLEQAAPMIQQLPPEQQQIEGARLNQMVQAIRAEQNDKVSRAERVCTFINWQLFNEIPEWEPDTDRLLLMLPLYGSMFRCTYYSADKKRICSDLDSPETLVVPMDTKHMADASRISKCFTLQPRLVREKVRAGIYEDVEISFEDEEAEAEEDFIEQYRWIDLDDDGYKEPYIVTVHKDTGKVFRISPNFRMEDVFANSEGEVTRIECVKYFTKYTFIPSTDGTFYDLGFFDLLTPINKAINSTANMMMDAGTLQNAGGGFISNDLGLRKKGPIHFGIGEYKSISTSGEDIRKSIYTMDFRGPSPVLFQLLGFMVDAGRDIANLKEVLEGDQSRNQPAATTMALIEQGLKVFSAIHKRIHRALGAELQLIRWWNAQVRNPLYGEVIDEEFKPEDFEDADLDFIPVSDPAVVTDMQKAGRVQFLMQFLNDPYFNQMELRKEIGEGIGIDGFEELLGQDPQVAQLQQQLQQAMQGIQALQAQVQDKTVKDQLEAIRVRAEIDEKESKSVLNETAAIKNLADAEAAEPGEQVPAYREQVQEIKADFEYDPESGQIRSAAG